MWQLCVSQAEKYDPQLVEGWKGQADSVLNIVRAELSSIMGNVSPNNFRLGSSPSSFPSF